MQTIQNLSELEDRLSEPTPEVVETFRRMDGDLIVLGVAGTWMMIGNLIMRRMINFRV